MTEEERAKVEIDLVDKAIQTLMDHVGACQIFTITEHDGADYVRRIMKGRGNFWTRYGAIKAWVTEQDAVLKHDACKAAEQDEE